MKARDLPVNAQMCPTCPFRDDGWTHLRAFLQERAMTEATPICHSTGKALVPRTKRLGSARLCRGSRDYQIQALYTVGFLDAPTDAAWDAKRKHYGV